MATSKKPRKKYRPPKVAIVPGHIKLFRFGRDSEMWLQHQPHQALESLRTGSATADDYDALSLRILWAAQMVKDHIIESEPLDIVTPALMALESIGQRYDRTGKLGMSGEEFRHLGNALGLADQLQGTLTRREMEQSFRTVMGARYEAIKRKPENPMIGERSTALPPR
jgi:hypothetical protein